jgi:hypothetical protein
MDLAGFNTRTPNFMMHGLTRQADSCLDAREIRRRHGTRTESPKVAVKWLAFLLCI